MSSGLRRQLREVLPQSIKGLPRAVALEIADDARWDDGRRYNPEMGRNSRATLADLVRWTAAKNERVVRDALRQLALAGWEFRVPFGKGADGRLLYAVPGRAAEFRVPDFEPLAVGSVDPEETVVTVSSIDEGAEETVTTAWETVTTVSEAVTTASEAVVTGPPSHVPQSPQDPTSSSPAEPVDTEPPAEPEVVDGGGGGSDLRSIAVEIARGLDYRGQIADKRQRQTIETRLVAALAAGHSVEWLTVYLDLGDAQVRSAASVYAARLAPDRLPDPEPLPVRPAARGGIWGDLPTAAEIQAATIDSVFACSQRRTTGPSGHHPYRNPVDQSVYSESFWGDETDRKQAV